MKAQRAGRILGVIRAQDVDDLAEQQRAQQETKPAAQAATKTMNADGGPRIAQALPSPRRSATMT